MKDLKDDYNGPFEPDFHLGKLSRSALTSLGREYMIFGQINDRVGLPQVALGYGPEVLQRGRYRRMDGREPHIHAANEKDPAF